MISYILKGRLIDAVSNEPVENGLVAVEGDRIAYAGHADGFSLKSEGAIVYNAGRGTIMPGFIDCHAHLCGEENAGSFAGGKFFRRSTSGQCISVRSPS